MTMGYQKFSDRRYEPQTLGGLGTLGAPNPRILSTQTTHSSIEIDAPTPPKAPKAPKVADDSADADHHQGPFGRALAALHEHCPDHVPDDRWQQAVADGQAFLAAWGERADRLGWTAQDLFGLHKPPETPHPSYRRLSRYDCTGLVWLLQGRPVVALTEVTAVNICATGYYISARARPGSRWQSRYIRICALRLMPRHPNISPFW
jgi:hypothetical protein